MMQSGRKSHVVVVICGVVLLVTVVTLAAGVVLEDRFDGTPGTVPEAWEPTMDGDAVVRLADVDIAPPSGGTVLELIDNSFIIAAMAERDFPAPISRGAVEFVVYNSPDNPGKIYGELRAAGAGTVADCHISAGRTFKCRDEKSLYELVTGVDHGVWHTVRIEWDTGTWTYRAYLNGVDVTPEGGLRFAQQAVPTGFRFKLGSGPKVDQRAFVDSVTATAL